MKVEHYYKPDSKTLREEPQVLTRWIDPTIEQLQQENKQLKEDIKKLEEGLFMCNALKEDYKKCNSDAVKWVKTNLRFLPTSKELLKILLTTNLKKENK